MITTKLLPAALFAVSAAIVSLPAAAGSASQLVSRASAANASARCQGSLPSFEGALRKRPLALQNEGTSTAFVTCGFIADQSDAGPIDFGLYARSTTGEAMTLTCTAVSGYDGSAVYSTKSVDLPASGAQASLYWYDEDFSVDLTSALYNLNCQLPPGAALNDMYYNYEQTIPAPTPAP